MKEIPWGGITSAYAAGKMIKAKEPFSLVISGDSAEALRKVAKPGIKLNREMLGVFFGNLSLTALPGLMLFALARKYHLDYENLGAGGVRMRFLTD